MILPRRSAAYTFMRLEAQPQYYNFVLACTICKANWLKILLMSMLSDSFKRNALYVCKRLAYRETTKEEREHF